MCMLCICRIHENPLGDEGIEKLVSGLIALHADTMPDATTDRLERQNTTTNEPGCRSDTITTDQSIGDDVVLNNALNDGAINQTPGKVNVLALKSLEIGACGMTAASACAVARLIRANIGITSLSITGNKGIKTAGWAEIADSLEHNTVINTLELHHNALENSGASLIAEALAGNTSIHTIDLEGNHIGDEGAQKIQKMLEVNGTVQTVQLRSGNEISESVLADIEHLLAERQRSSNTT